MPKNHPRVEAYGDLDELISFIGIVISDTGIEKVKTDLRKIQEDLMLISAHLQVTALQRLSRRLVPDQLSGLRVRLMP